MKANPISGTIMKQQMSLLAKNEWLRNAATVLTSLEFLQQTHITKLPKLQTLPYRLAAEGLIVSVKQMLQKVNCTDFHL